MSAAAMRVVRRKRVLPRMDDAPALPDAPKEKDAPALCECQRPREMCECRVLFGYSKGRR